MVPVRWRRADTSPAGRVAPVEIFFDVVFVLTLLQLTQILEADLSLAAFGRVALIFAVLWFMYTGYAWLTNQVPPRLPYQKVLLLAGMAGFLLTAVGLPDAVTGTAVFFGLGYLLVACVHFALFAQFDIRFAVLLAPYNLGSALLILAAGFVGSSWAYLLWGLAFLLQTVVPYLLPRWSWVGRAGLFHLNAEHFVERHNLLVIVALGESVVAIGLGLRGAHLTAGTAVAVLLALAVPAAMWWTYFSNTSAASRVLAAAEPGLRTRLAAPVYIFAHVLLLLGIVVTAAGIHDTVAHPGAAVEPATAVALSGGVALFLGGIAVGLRVLSVGSWRNRLTAAVATLATIPVGTAGSAALHLCAVIGVLLAMLAADHRRAARRPA